MKAMPIKLLLADEEYVYNPQLDEWIVEKKSGNKKLSKKDIVGYDGGYSSQEDATYMGWGPYGSVPYEPATHDSQTGLREGDTGEPLVICPKCKSDKIEKYNE